MARSRFQLRGPLTRMARLSKICSGVSWDSNVGEVVDVAVPKLPSRNSVAPLRKKLRHVAFSAP